MELRGTVVRDRIGAGTKSERESFLLVTNDGRRLHLRVKGGNPIYDARFEPLLGQEVVGNAEVVGPVAIFESEPRPASPGGA